MSPIPTFTGLPPFATFEDVVNKFNKLTAEMQNLFLSLDTLNVVSLRADVIDAGTLNAGVVTIRSDLTGGAYIKIDGTGMIVNNGTKDTLKIDSNGNLTAEDGIITGGTLRTAASGNRIEITGNQLKTYSSSNQLLGMVLGPSDAGYSYGDVFLYDNGVKVLEFYNNLLGAGYTIRPVGTASLFLGTGGKTTLGQGVWEFTESFDTQNTCTFKIHTGTAFDTLSQADSTATTVAGIVSDFNALLSKLRLMNILA